MFWLGFVVTLFVGVLGFGFGYVVGGESKTESKSGRLPDHLRDVPLGERGQLWEQRRDEVLGR